MSTLQPKSALRGMWRPRTVDGGGRLVEQQDVGLRDEGSSKGSREADELPLKGGEDSSLAATFTGQMVLRPSEGSMRGPIREGRCRTSTSMSLTLRPSDREPGIPLGVADADLQEPDDEEQ